jgi:diguanylate cyclase (GGDEF)-like protein/hemerythrin-like metal-binding protein
MQRDSEAPVPANPEPVDPRTLGAMLANSTVIALAQTCHGRIVFANPAFLAMFQAADALTGLSLVDIVVDAGGDRLVEALAAAEYAPVRYVGVGRRGNDPPFDLEMSLECTVLDGEPGVVVLASDVTEEYHSKEQLVYLAYTDGLTRLANGALFADRLYQSVRRARSHGTMFAVLMIDLDGFKAINDTFGHETGDVALQLVGKRFQGSVRDGDTLARIGGDEFAVLLPRVTDQQAAAVVAQRIIAALAAPLDFGTHSVSVGASVGIAVWSEHAESGDALLAAADTAMYRAKRTGGNRFCWATRRIGEDITSLQPLAWGAAHAIGIQDIDDQHRHLVEHIDRLSAALVDALDSDAILARLNDLVRYAEFHFAAEELMMEQHQVPDLARHREEHRRLLYDIRNLHVVGDIGSISLILRYLQEWLLHHVDGADRQLGQMLIALGCR